MTGEYRSRTEMLAGRIPSDQLAALLRASGALASSLDLDEVLQVAITSACEVMRLETGAIYLLDRDTLVLQATDPPLPGDFPEEFRAAPLSDHPHIAECVRLGHPVSIEDVESAELTPAERGVCDARGLRSILYVPLTSAESAVGTFILGSTSETSTFDDVDTALASTLGHQIALAVANAQLHESIQRANDDLLGAYDATLVGWATAMEMRDHETRGHADHVEKLAVDLGGAMGLSGEDLEHLRRGALLHDIGKMTIPDAILHKAGPLDEAEWEVMRTHPEIARALLASIGYLAPALEVPYCHHERWDGSGYPRGLRGEEIPLSARIFAVVDVYDALTSDRPYRSAWTHDAARAHVAEQAGAHFDPDVVDAFLGLIDRTAE